MKKIKGYALMKGKKYFDFRVKNLPRWSKSQKTSARSLGLTDVYPVEIVFKKQTAKTKKWVNDNLI